MKLLMSTQFKKDLKRYQNKPRKIASLKAVLKSLSECGIVPDSYYPHPLHGDFKGYMECHVEGEPFHKQVKSSGILPELRCRCN